MMRADDILRSQPYRIVAVGVCGRHQDYHRSVWHVQLADIRTYIKITLHTSWCTCACTNLHEAALMRTHASVVFHR
jgi:hypothetical protein